MSPTRPVLISIAHEVTRSITNALDGMLAIAGYPLTRQVSLR